MSARTTGFSGLTIRSSRVRFAASTRCGKLVHLVVAAPLPGLAQALGGLLMWSGGPKWSLVVDRWKLGDQKIGGIGPSRTGYFTTPDQADEGEG